MEHGDWLCSGSDECGDELLESIDHGEYLSDYKVLAGGNWIYSLIARGIISFDTVDNSSQNDESSDRFRNRWLRRDIVRIAVSETLPRARLSSEPNQRVLNWDMLVNKEVITADDTLSATSSFRLLKLRQTVLR